MRSPGLFGVALVCVAASAAGADAQTVLPASRTVAEFRAEVKKARDENTSGRQLVALFPCFAPEAGYIVVKAGEGELVRISLQGARARVTTAVGEMTLLQQLDPLEAAMICAPLTDLVDRGAMVDYLEAVADAVGIPLLKATFHQFSRRDLPSSLSAPQRLLLSFLTRDVAAQALRDDVASRRKAGALALGIGGDPADVPAVAALISNSDPDVARAALLSLLWFDSDTARQAIAYAGAAAIPNLSKLVHDPRSWYPYAADGGSHTVGLFSIQVSLIRARALDALVRSGDAGIPVLVERLADADDVRAALLSLGVRGREALAHALESGAPPIRRAALEALVKDGTPSEALLLRGGAATASQLYTRGLERNSRTRRESFSLLTRMGDAALPSLISGLSHADAEVRGLSMAALLGSVAGYELALREGPRVLDALVWVAYGRWRPMSLPSEPALVPFRSFKPGVELHDLAFGGVMDLASQPQGVTAIERLLLQPATSTLALAALLKLGWAPSGEELTVFFHLAAEDAESRWAGAKIPATTAAASARWIRNNRARVSATLVSSLPRCHEAPNCSFIVETLIALGTPSALPALKQHLWQRGTPEQGTMFLNSGHAELESEARSWAAAKGHTIVKIQGSSANRWGSR
jgi:HEAT repeat protein